MTKTSVPVGWLAFCAMVAALTGCAHSFVDCQSGRRCCDDAAVTTSDVPELETEFQRRALALSATGSVSFDAPHAYRVLTDRDCQCQAAAAAPVANLLDSQALSLQERSERCMAALHSKKHERDRLVEVVLVDRALESRNKSAGAALELYHRLAEAEAKRILNAAAIQEMAAAASQAAAMRRRGIRPPLDDGALHRQELSLRADAGQLRLAIDSLNSQLAQVLGLPCGAPAPIWPAGWSETCATPPDPESAIAVGLASRPELVLLRTVQQELSANTLSVARQLLATVDPLLGAGGRRAKLLLCLMECLGKEPEELAKVRKQLDDYIETRTRQIAEEIRSAGLALPTHAGLVAAAQARALSWERRVAELAELHAKGLLSFAELTSARLESLRARGEVVKEVAALHIAMARLKQAQGLLILECGYIPIGCGAAHQGRGNCSIAPAEQAPDASCAPSVTGAESKACKARP